jgi:uncharacterized membrane protein
MKGVVKGAVKAALPKKQTRVLGLPIGPRHTDWVRVGKLAAMGAGAVSTAAGGVGAKLAEGKPKDKSAESAERAQGAKARIGSARETIGGAKETIQKVGGKAAEGASAIGEAVTGKKEPGGGKNVKELRHIIKESIDVGVPLKTAYNQWTQFEEMPAIMRGPQKVEQEADEEISWTAKIGPSRRDWTAKILEQNPDERIAWESADGTENRGTVTFHRLDRNLTRIQVEMEYIPRGFVEKVGNLFLAARRRVRKDLRLFKHYLEVAGTETGGWRGEISTDEQGQTEVQPPEDEEQGEGQGGAPASASESETQGEGSEEEHHQEGVARRQREREST